MAFSIAITIIPAGFFSFIVAVNSTPPDDVPDLTKKLIQSAIANADGLHYEEYDGSTKHALYALYCV